VIAAAPERPGAAVRDRAGSGTDRAADAPARLQLLIVELDRHPVGLLASQVQELAAAVAVTPLPRSPRFVEGAIDWRGEVIAVVDLRARLGLPARSPRLDDHLVIARAGDRVVALRVDHAADLVTVPAADLRGGQGLTAAPHVAGLTTLATGLVVVHDLQALLTAAEATRLEQALAALRPKQTTRRPPRTESRPRGRDCTDG